MTHKLAVFGAILLTALTVIGTTGCKGSDSNSSGGQTEEVKLRQAFTHSKDAGPMPEETRKKMEAAMSRMRNGKNAAPPGADGSASK